MSVADQRAAKKANLKVPVMMPIAVDFKVLLGDALDVCVEVLHGVDGEHSDEIETKIKALGANNIQDIDERDILIDGDRFLKLIVEEWLQEGTFSSKPLLL